MFSGINNNAETSIAVSEKWIECMSGAFLQGEAWKWKLGDTKSRTSNQTRCNSPGSGELWELTSFIQSWNLTQSSQYVTVLKKGWREMVLEREQGSYCIPSRLTFLPIRNRGPVFLLTGRYCTWAKLYMRQVFYPAAVTWSENVDPLSCMMYLHSWDKHQLMCSVQIGMAHAARLYKRPRRKKKIIFSLSLSLPTTLLHSRKAGL